MSTNETLDIDPVAATACHPYDADLHAAHQSHVEAWITAASDQLHQAVAEDLAAIATHQTARHGGPDTAQASR